MSPVGYRPLFGSEVFQCESNYFLIFRIPTSMTQCCMLKYLISCSSLVCCAIIFCHRRVFSLSLWELKCNQRATVLGKCYSNAMHWNESWNDAKSFLCGAIAKGISWVNTPGSCGFIRELCQFPQCCLCALTCAASRLRWSVHSYTDCYQKKNAALFSYSFVKCFVTFFFWRCIISYRIISHRIASHHIGLDGMISYHTRLYCSNHT